MVMRGIRTTVAILERAAQALLTNAGVVLKAGSDVSAPTRIAREVLGEGPTLPCIQ
jgi:hypothetical protein